MVIITQLIGIGRFQRAWICCSQQIDLGTYVHPGGSWP